MTRGSREPRPVTIKTDDSTDVEHVAAALEKARFPENSQQYIEASVSAVDHLLQNDRIIRNDRAYGIAVRLAQRLEEYLVVSGGRTPSVFAEALWQDSQDPLIAVIRTEFFIEMNSLVRELWTAIQMENASTQSTGEQFQNFEDFTARLRVGEAQRKPEEVATAMQLPTETVFAQFPEIVNEGISFQRRIMLENPFAQRYVTYWSDRQRATAIVRGIENPQPEQLPLLSDLIATRGEHAAFLLTEEREQLEQTTGDNKVVIEALGLLEAFLDQVSAEIDDIHTSDQTVLARRLVNLNFLRQRPEDTIALLNACETVKQHNPELFFRLLGISTSLTDGTATESDVFGNPLMIALDQTNRDLASRDVASRKVSPGFAVLRDRMDALLSTDPNDRRSPLPYLNEQQLRAAEQALQQALQGTDETKGPNVIAMTMMLKYTPVLELGKFMREVGFERRGEYVERLRNGTPREILADLMDMPEALLEDPEVLAAWRERYDLDHPEQIHRFAMRLAFNPSYDIHVGTKTTKTTSRSYLLSTGESTKLYGDKDLESLVKQERVMVIEDGVVKLRAQEEGGAAPQVWDDAVISEMLKSRQKDLMRILASIERLRVIPRALRRRMSSTYDLKLVDEIISKPIDVFSVAGNVTDNMEESHFRNFVLGLWARYPKDGYKNINVFDKFTKDVVDTLLRGVYVSDRYFTGYSEDLPHSVVPSNESTLGVIVSLLPREDWMSDDDWCAGEIGESNMAAMKTRKFEDFAPLIRTLDNNPYIQPGRLFAALFDGDRPLPRSMLGIVRCQGFQPKNSQYREAFLHNLRRAYYHIAQDDVYLSRMAAGEFQLIKHPELLTPIERELNDLIEPLVMQRLQSEILKRIEKYSTQQTKESGHLHKSDRIDVEWFSSVAREIQNAGPRASMMFNNFIDSNVAIGRDSADPVVQMIIRKLADLKLPISEPDEK